MHQRTALRKTISRLFLDPEWDSCRVSAYAGLGVSHAAVHATTLNNRQTSAHRAQLIVIHNLTRTHSGHLTYFCRLSDKVRGWESCP